MTSAPTVTPSADQSAARYRQPFVGLPTVSLVRDAIAVAALLVGLSSYWSNLTRGADHPIIVIATVIGLCGIALPYLHRAHVIDLPWTQDPMMRLWFLAPLLACCVADLVTDAIPGGDWGIGVGMALSLAGAILAIWSRWRGALPLLSVVALVVALASPLVTAWASDFVWPVIVSALLTALFITALWWFTAGQYLRGHVGAGVLLLGLGLAVTLAMMLLGGSNAQPWFESLPNAMPGLMLLPALAAAAAPEVLGEYDIEVRQPTGGRPDADDEYGDGGAAAGGPGESDVGAALPGHDALLDGKARVWSSVAANALLVATAYGALTVAHSVVAGAHGGFDQRGIIRLILGAVLGLIAFRCWQVFHADRTLGFGPTIATAVLVALLGLAIVLASGPNELPASLQVLASFALPATILSALLVPRSFARAKRAMSPGDLRSLARFGPLGAPGSGGKPTAVAESANEDATDDAEAIADSEAIDDVEASGDDALEAGLRPPASAPMRVATGRTGTAEQPLVPTGHPASTSVRRVSATDLASTPVRRVSVTDPASTPERQVLATEPVSAPIPEALAVVHEADDAYRGTIYDDEAVFADDDEFFGTPPPDLAESAAAPRRTSVLSAAVAAAEQEFADEGPIDPALLTGPVLTGPRWTPQQAADPNTALTDLQRIAHEAPHLRPLVAGNPSAYPGLIDWLAQLGDPDVDLALQRRG